MLDHCIWTGALVQTTLSADLNVSGLTIGIPTCARVFMICTFFRELVATVNALTQPGCNVGRVR